MIKDRYYSINSIDKKQAIIDLRFWLMWDLYLANKGIHSRQVDVVIANLQKIPRNWFSDDSIFCLSKEYVERILIEAVNGMNATFQKQIGMDPLLMTHRGLL